ncbi:MAG: hypothetical protein GF347_01645, partial [Candidatus Moranbacteria bacterium]|nr:hypothetical protein [Candidatus Moranbacteria bacterium]
YYNGRFQSLVVSANPYSETTIEKLDCYFEPCDQDGDGYKYDADCDDSDPFIYPDAPERCNNLDDNCDGDHNDEALMTTWYLDTDYDGYGTDATGFCVDPPKKYSSANGDCNDKNNKIYPGAKEIPDDGIDQDCDGNDLSSKSVDLTIEGKAYISTHINDDTERGYEKADDDELYLFTKGGTLKKKVTTDERGHFLFENLDLNPETTYYLKGSKKKSVPKKYFYKRLYLYQKKYEKTFGPDWIKKFKKKYRILKKGSEYGSKKYYRKYKGIQKVKPGDREVKFRMR